jgi:hypothetical protein
VSLSRPEAIYIMKRIDDHTGRLLVSDVQRYIEEFSHLSMQAWLLKNDAPTKTVPIQRAPKETGKLIKGGRP